MDSAGLRWYRTGTVDITQGSANVIGVGTNWQTAGIQPGDVFMVGNSVLYEIAQVVSNTSIALHSAFQGATGTAQNYSILRNFAGTMQAQIAAQVSELVNKYESYIDTELKQIVGPAGPTSFPYMGTWATGRQYNALDVVEYSGALYMAIAGHTSTTDNAPGATNTEWVSLAVSLSGTALTEFANGASVNPNGVNGISIVGKNASNDVTLSATADAIRLQQTAGGTTTTLAEYEPKKDTGFINAFAADRETQIESIKYRIIGNICEVVFANFILENVTTNVSQKIAYLPPEAQPSYIYCIFPIALIGKPCRYVNIRGKSSTGMVAGSIEINGNEFSEGDRLYGNIVYTL